MTNNETSKSYCLLRPETARLSLNNMSMQFYIISQKGVRWEEESTIQENKQTIQNSDVSKEIEY